MPLTLFVNVTRQCNVDCQRCYLTPENRASRLTLSKDTVLRFIRLAEETAPVEVVIWQGGEATIVGEAHMRDLAEAVRIYFPHIRQTMVTNLFSLPEWLPELAREYFNGQVETTYAAGAKANLAGDEQSYQARFAAHFKTLTNKHGIVCPVNVELNQETISAGPGDLFDWLLETGVKVVEFDVSANFEAFFKAPVYSEGIYPHIPPTVPYEEVSSFLAYCLGICGIQPDEWPFESASLRDLIGQPVLKEPAFFAVGKGHSFLTLNPDGTITTNPLFSDLAPTYLGSCITGIDKDKWETFGRMELRRTIRCLTCSHYVSCKGGPPHLPIYDNPYGRPGECIGFRYLRNSFQRLDTGLL